MAETTLHAWSATQSGAAMTISGQDDRGVVRRIAGVIGIASQEDGSALATRRDGSTLRLASSQEPAR